jgi:hypothetical protein
MTQDEIMQLAKDAGLRIDVRGKYFFVGFVELSDLLDAAIAKEREALAQTQEPVAWMFQHDETRRMNYVSNDGVHYPTIFLEMNPRYALVCPLYAHPPQRTEQEPVKIAHRHEWFRTSEMKVGQMRCISCGTWGHEEMPQRTWVGLTNDEIDSCFEDHGWSPSEDYYPVIKAIEAKLKEKNT